MRNERVGREKTRGEDGESYKQMSLRDLKLDTKDNEGGASETQMRGGKKGKAERKKAIRERPKQQYKSRKREKCARACTQTQFQRTRGTESS